MGLAQRRGGASSQAQSSGKPLIRYFARLFWIPDRIIPALR
jgi:hypothetical protein